MIEPTNLDVCILGGGLAGLTLAIQLTREEPDIAVAVIENRAHPVPEAAFKVGESSVEVGAHYFANVIGLKEHIRDKQLPKLGLRYFMPAGRNDAIERRMEFGGNNFLAAPSFQLDRGRFENHLATVAAAAGVQFLSETSVRDVRLDPDGDHEIDVKPRGADSRTLRSRWVVDATGRASLLKRRLELEKSVDHDVNAAWFRIDRRIKIDDWSDDASWAARMGKQKASRWLSTNHLMGEGYWVWLIPLASGSTSVGIVADAGRHPYETINSFDKSLAWLEQHEPQCAGVVHAHKDALQDFMSLEDFSYSCNQVFSGDRWCLTGEAGVFLDPFYSPGSDYIGFANTFITHLVGLDRRGKNITARSQICNDIYFQFFYGQLTLYQDQYAIMRHPRIMPLKIVWDFAYYWSLQAFIFFQDRLCDLQMYARFGDLLKEGDVLNREMQANFGEWNRTVDTTHQDCFMDVTDLAFMRQLNRELLQTFDGDAFGERLRENMAQLHVLADEMRLLVESFANDEAPSPLIHLLEGVHERLFAG
jgi:flavin-dependent dehydrogenase